MFRNRHKTVGARQLPQTTVTSERLFFVIFGVVFLFLELGVGFFYLHYRTLALALEAAPHNLNQLANSEYIWAYAGSALLSLVSGAVAYLVSARLTIHDRLAEQNLKDYEELFSIILSGLNDGVYDYDVPNGKISYSSYAKLLGYEENGLSAEHDRFYELMHPEDVPKASQLMEDYMARKIPHYYNVFRVRHRDGRWIWLLSRGIGVWDKDGNILRLVGTHTDITIHKEREEQLAQMIDKNEQQRELLLVAKDKAEAANIAKSEFLATMSHEIRTPLNAVIGLARLLQKTRLDERQKTMAEVMSVNADALLQLIDNVLNFSRLESGQVTLDLKPFSFTQIFSGLHSMFDAQAQEKGLNFLTLNETDDTLFMGDAARIQQILMNLVGNALKFTAQGHISVTAIAEPTDSGESRVAISVSDTGVGIPPEKQKDVFEKFVQADQSISRRYGGSGLGLAICKSLISLMSGDIQVQSEVGKGTNFIISLPLPVTGKQKSAPAGNITPLHKSAPATLKNILLVEDYEPNIMVATLILEDLGYTADIARNGPQALQIIQNCAAPYSAILMDVQMPGMDGYETTRHMRMIEKGKGYRNHIIGVTAHALVGDRQKCLDAGMDDYISKPINPEALAEKLSNAKKEEPSAIQFVQAT